MNIGNHDQDWQDSCENSSNPPWPALSHGNKAWQWSSSWEAGAFPSVLYRCQGAVPTPGYSTSPYPISQGCCLLSAVSVFGSCAFQGLQSYSPALSTAMAVWRPSTYTLLYNLWVSSRIRNMPLSHLSWVRVALGMQCYGNELTFLLDLKQPYKWYRSQNILSWTHKDHQVQLLSERPLQGSNPCVTSTVL